MYICNLTRTCVLKYSGFRTPVECVNAPHIPLGVGQRDRRKPFFLWAVFSRNGCRAGNRPRFASFSRLAFGTPDFDDSGQDGYHDNNEDQPFQVFLYDSQSAEEIAGISEQNYPNESPDDMIRGKMAVAHVSHSGDEEGEYSDDRNETSQNNRFASVFPDIIFVCTKRGVKIDVLY